MSEALRRTTVASLPAAEPGAVPAQRVDGLARLAYRRTAAGGTALADLYQRAPCRLLFPRVERGEPPQAVLLTTSGGLTGGDRLEIEFDVGEAAGATLTTQAAEKLYRGLPGEAPASVGVKLRAGPSAWAEWLAQETILFDRSGLRRDVELDLAPGAKVLALESLVLGREAMGECYTGGTLYEGWRIRRDGRLVWADALGWREDCGARDAPFGFGRARACATLIYAGDDAAACLGRLRDLLAGSAPIGAAGVIDGVLVLRLLSADAAAMRKLLMRAAALIRHVAGGLPQRMPHVWNC